MAQSREMVEGSEAFDRFRNALKTVLSVPKDKILKHERKEKQAKRPTK